MKEDFWHNLLSHSKDLAVSFGMKLIYAIIVLLIGLFLIKILRSFVLKIMKRRNIELSLQSFIESLTNIVLYAALFMIIGFVFGMDTTAFVGIFGAAGIAIGLALQGSLANFAGGVLILIFKPFRIGDEVILEGVQGEVIDINILYTVLDDWRGQHYSLPNGKVANSVMTNNSAEEYRRVQIELHFSHHEDIDQLREIITGTMRQNPDAIQDKPFQFWVSNFQDYYIKTSARCWAKSSEYWGVYWAQEEAIKKALAKHNIKLAIPKREIYYGEKSDA